jgi:hypothetical protein
MKNAKVNREEKMKLISSAAIVLSLGLLSLQPAAAFDNFDNDVANKLPRDGLDALGLPIGYTIAGKFTIPQHTTDELLSTDHMDDIAKIIQLKNMYIFYHDSANGVPLSQLFVPGGIFEDPYQDGAGHICGPNNIAIGYDAIAKYFGNATPPIPFTKHSHHVMTAPLVKVDSNGSFATLTGNFADSSASTGVTTWGHMGEYIDDFVKIGGSWKFVHLRPLEDEFPQAGVNPCQ